MSSAQLTDTTFQRRLRRRHLVGAIWGRIFLAATFVGFVMLVLLFAQVLAQNLSWVRVEQRTVLTRELEQIQDTFPLFEGLREREAVEAELGKNETFFLKFWLSPHFLISPPPDALTVLKGGFLPAIVGTLWVVGIAALIAFPLGVGAAIWLEEYAPRDHWLTEIIQTNIANLAGVPSIVYGMLGLQVFARSLMKITQGRTVISGGLTMALLVLPIMIIAAREAIRAVPNSIRQAAFGLGATRWQTVRHQVLPAALPGIFTGTILSISRAIGEAAPLVMLGALTYVKEPPLRIDAPFTVMPIQIFNWTSQPQAEFRNLAAAGIIVLLIILLSLNALAIILRNRAETRW
jgi:phosphate transport system permease protein